MALRPRGEGWPGCSGGADGRLPSPGIPRWYISANPPPPAAEVPLVVPGVCSHVCTCISGLALVLTHSPTCFRKVNAKTQSLAPNAY